MSHIARYVLILCALAHTCLAAAPSEFKNVERVVAVGDIHGDYAGFVAVLRAAGLLDAKDRWSGGKTHLVQTGDIPDRGPDTRKIMDLMMQLEKDASKAGGRVHALIGNHEAMNLYGDLRYVTPAEYAAFATKDSEKVRAALWTQETKDKPNPPSAAEQKKWEAEHPLGWVEHRIAHGTEGVYGKWIRSHNVVVKINDAIYLHGGISPRYATTSVKELNEIVLKELNDFSLITEQGPVLSADGPLWFRGLSDDEAAATPAHVDQVLNTHGIKRIVVAHTPTGGAVTSRFGGKVVVIDVGISAAYGSHRACLSLEGGKPFAIHQGQKMELPAGGPEYLAYLKKALALEPPGTTLAKYVSQVEAAMAASK